MGPDLENLTLWQHTGSIRKHVEPVETRFTQLLELTAGCNPSAPEVACGCCTYCFCLYDTVLDWARWKSQEGQADIEISSSKRERQVEDAERGYRKIWKIAQVQLSWAPCRPPRDPYQISKFGTVRSYEPTRNPELPVATGKKTNSHGMAPISNCHRL
jgi:hypothetical protein